MKISYGKQYVDQKDANYLVKSLHEKFITNGKNVSRFEKKIKKKLNARFCIACNNATSGLFLAFKAINLKKNDVVIMPAINFIASYSMAKFLGAKIFLCDVDEITGQITAKTLNKCIKTNKITKIKAIITMYLGGYPSNVMDVYKVKKKYNFFIIEDSCHAFGASYTLNKKRYKVGSNNHSDISIFSFHPIKPITTGEGGAITTKNPKFFKIIKSLRNHGILRKKNYWDYDIEELSFNFRISDINCALGISQLNKLQKFLKKRKLIFNWYKKIFKREKNLNLVIPSKNITSTFHLILLNINFKNLKINKNDFFTKLNKKNIYPQFHYKPIQLFKFYKESKKNLNNSLKYMNRTISLPVYHKLKKEDVKKISKNILNITQKKF